MSALANSAWAAFTPDLVLVFVHMKEVTRHINVFTFPYVRNNKWAYFSVDGAHSTPELLGSMIQSYVPNKRYGSKPFKLPLYLNLTMFSATLPPLVKILERMGHPPHHIKPTKEQAEEDKDKDKDYEDDVQEDDTQEFHENLPNENHLLLKDGNGSSLPSMSSLEGIFPPPIDGVSKRTTTRLTQDEVVFVRQQGPSDIKTLLNRPKLVTSSTSIVTHSGQTQARLPDIPFHAV